MMLPFQSAFFLYSSQCCFNPSRPRTDNCASHVTAGGGAHGMMMMIMMTEEHNVKINTRKRHREMRDREVQENRYSSSNRKLK